MKTKTKSGLRWVIFSVLCVSLTACNSAHHLFVKKTDLQALDQCLLTQQSQQQLFVQQLAQYEQDIKSLNETVEEQKKLAEIPPPPPAKPAPVIVCPKPAPRPVQATNVNDTAFQDKQIVGEKEQVLLNDLDITLPARIDTGATTASLDARDIRTFERDGEEWVRFNVINPQTQATVEVERKRVRRVQILQPGTEESERRPVVEMRITLGKITQNAQFTLTDRSNLELPMLVGRNIMRDVMLVDVSRSEIAPPARQTSKESASKAQEASKPAQKAPQ